DDYDLRFYDCDSSYERAGAQQQQIEYFQIGHYMGYDLVGRTEVEPTPIDPDFKATGRYWLFGLYPILAPNEIRGSGFIRWRYADRRRGDDIGDVAAGPRRVRRVDESIMSSSTTTNGPSAHAWIPTTIRASIPRPSSTTTSSWARGTCSRPSMRCIHRKC